MPELIDPIIAAEHQLYDAFFARIHSPIHSPALIRILPREFGWKISHDGNWFPCNYQDEISSVTRDSYGRRNEILDPVETYTYPYPLLNDTQPLTEQLLPFAAEYSTVSVMQLSHAGFNTDLTEATFLVKVVVLSLRNESIAGRQHFTCYFAHKQEDRWVISLDSGPEDFPIVVGPPHSYLDSHYIGEPTRYYAPPPRTPTYEPRPPSSPTELNKK